MNFKNFRLLTLIEILIIAFIYPIVKMLISTSNKMLILSDTLLIEAAILVIIAIIYNLYLKGDFKYSFIIFNKIFHKNINSEKYLKDDKSKRENSFNYSLLVSIILIVISFVTGYLFA